MKSISLLLIYFTFFFTAQSQDIDSLKKVFESDENLDSRFTTLSLLAKKLDETYSKELGNLNYFEQLISYGRKRADSVVVAKGWYYIGWNHYLNDNILSSIEAYQNALLSLEYIDTEDMLKANINNELGMNYSDLKAYNLSLQKLKLTESYLKKANNSLSQAKALGNITRLYSLSGKSDSVERYATLALKAFKKLSIGGLSTTINAGIVTAYYYLSKYDSAINYLEKSLYQAIKNNDRPKISTAYQMIGYSYYQQKKYSEAKKYLIDYDSLNVIESPTVYEYLAEIFKFEGNYKKAIYYYDQKAQLNEDAFGPLTREKVFISQQDLKDEIKNKLISQAKEEASTSRIFNFLLLIILIITLLGIVFLSITYRQKRKSEKQLKALNEKIELRNQKSIRQSKALKKQMIELQL